ncbi:MAG: SDR family NAD(P)-dependent oxidoreductase [Janthinobacterium lividum]
MTQMELRQKVTLVTGAGAGIGRAAAELFGRNGARLLLSDVDPDAVETVAASIRSRGGEACIVEADISNEDDVARMVEHAISVFGRLDLALNNAGIGHKPVSLPDVALGDWQRVIDINLTGTFLCMKHEIRRMRATGGSIVNVASMSGLAATPRMSPYSASKHGVIGLTRTAAAEFAAENIRVNAICPTATDTPGLRTYISQMGVDPARMNGPMGRMGLPSEIAEMAMWLLSERASFVTGQAVGATGGSAGQTA